MLYYRDYVIAGAALAALVVLARQKGKFAQGEGSGVDVVMLPGEIPSEPAIDAQSFPAVDQGDYDVHASDLDTKTASFLHMIRRAEHSANDVATSRDYTTLYKGGQFSDMSDHPGITGEFEGFLLPDEWCIKAGLNPPCRSFAAGAYQFNKQTWRDVRDQNPRLPDFSPASQDEGARRLLVSLGVVAALDRGDFQDALRRASARWASLPGSRSGQGQRTLAQVASWYQEGVA